MYNVNRKIYNVHFTYTTIIFDSTIVEVNDLLCELFYHLNELLNPYNYNTDNISFEYYSYLDILVYKYI